MTRRASYGLLIALTLATFLPVRLFDFVTFDDPAYIYKNPYVEKGLTWKGIQWALTADLTFDSPSSDHWQPVTWIWRMLEVELFGLRPSFHHLVNLALHLANVLLLFEVLRRMTRDHWRSTLVAAIFAVHPLHVEAVAWVTALKDVLSGFFWMLTLWAYLRYTAQRTPLRYVLVLFLTVLTMMSKPIAMTLPFILILMDVWPLRRIPVFSMPSKAWWMEKIPLLALSATSATIAFLAQREHFQSALSPGAMVLSLGYYVCKSIVPTGLCVWHPAWEHPPLVPTVASALLLALITTVAIHQRKTLPHLLTGWIWFIITLLPVLSLKEVAWAERFTYLPLIGLGIMAAWSLPTWKDLRGRNRNVLALGTAGVMGLFVFLSRQQLTFWSDSVSLYEHALAVTPNNYWIHNSLGVVWAQSKDYTRAENHFREAIHVRPGHAQSYWNFGNMLMDTHRFDEAIIQYRKAFELTPGDSEIAASLGSAYSAKGQMTKAIETYRAALALNPKSIKASCELGVLYVQLGKIEEGMDLYRHALQVEPENAALCNNMGNALLQKGNFDEAAQYYRQARISAPELASVRNNLGTALMLGGKFEDAIEVFQETLRRNPTDGRARYNLATCYLRTNQPGEARAELERTAAMTASPFARQAAEDLHHWDKK